MAMVYEIQIKNSASPELKIIDQDVNTLELSITKVNQSMSDMNELSKTGAKEFENDAKKKEDTINKLAELDEKIRVASLTEEERKRELLLANYEMQRDAMLELHDLQIECEGEKLELLEEQQERYGKMYEIYKKQEDAIDREVYEKKMQRLAGYFGAAAAGMEFAAKTLEGYQAKGTAYRLAYKAAAISEASMSATQSILKTMAGTPYPWNIPLVAAQAAAAAVKVNEIRKMYTGGMIPGANTLIMANEQGREAILNPMAVRAVGGEAGVNALNYGTNNYSYDSSSNNTIVINTSVMTQKAFRDEIEPILRQAERRR